MIATFGDNEFKATVEFCGKNMHKVTYIDPGMDEPFENYIFNDDREEGEKDSITMAKEFVNQREKRNGK